MAYKLAGQSQSGGRDKIYTPLWAALLAYRQKLQKLRPGRNDAA